jgi:hypothetical protein
MKRHCKLSQGETDMIATFDACGGVAAASILAVEGIDKQQGQSLRPSPKSGMSTL